MASPTPAPPPAGASCAVPLARIVSQEVAALYSISECREQWQRLRGFPTWYLKLADLPFTLLPLVAVRRWLGVTPVANQVETALTQAELAEAEVLQRLGRLAQWQQQHLPGAKLLRARPILQAAPPVVDALLELLQRHSGGVANVPDTARADQRLKALRARQPEPLCQAPSWLHIYWPVLVAGGGALLLGSKLWRGLGLTDALSNWISDAVITVKRFNRERLWEPIVAMYKTVRYDENQFAAQSAKSLESDLESLTRMVLAFGAECLTMSPDDLDALRRQVHEGDLTPVMKSYELEMKHPVRGILLGDMLRTTLIQVQKSKVDLQLALSAMDKLLKSNELVIQMLAVLPALIIAGAAGVVAMRFLRRRTRTSLFQSADDLRHRLLEVARAAYATGDEKLNATQRLEAEGHLVAVCHSMSRAIRTAIFLSGNDKKQLIADLEELLAASPVPTGGPVEVRATSERRHHILSIVKLAIDVHANNNPLW